MIDLTPQQLVRADQLINFFEYSTLIIDYKTAENIGDGRGITAGRAGFTSATGDMFLVVKLYTEKDATNPLAVYLPRLQKLAAQGSENTDGLEGLEQAWKTAANDPVFREVQDQVVNQLYYTPAKDAANQQGLTLPLSLAVLYDTIIQHGGGTDPDSLQSLINRTNQAMGGSPATGVDEKAWLQKFLSVRRADLTNPFDKSTRDAWRESVGRCDILKAIADSGDYTLSHPIQLTPTGHFVVDLTPDTVNLALFPGNQYAYETDVTGNAFNNTLKGNVKSNVLSGLDGDDLLLGAAGKDLLIGGQGRDDIAGGKDNDWIDLGNNGIFDQSEDTVIYALGDGKDTVTLFERTGNTPDFLLFKAIDAIDVVTRGNSTQFRLSDGIRGNSGFGQGQLLVKLIGVTGFTASNIANNLTENNTTGFLFR